MNEKHYLFIFQDESRYDMTSVIGIKDAVWEMAKYNGEGSEMLYKCMGGYDSDDIEGIIELYNHFVYNPIIKVYTVEDVLYSIDS